ncbi:helix-turn-helix domain-containing protein [Algoriphagus kandeliae]|uniref:Helix-turn-helix domain-containing protein n=1 Tax=Algoriphagus kandeliae TaxID=2562278 RepID=A0A4Y9QQK0_9BACT|nr:helix-turn-helix domain-containing protein [Algoriphagus kandeliae]TFV94490.1 helix-turn-helix domain-containing protein [Algoriphagus kandeliae]
MKKSNKKGLWIPIEILEDKNLNSTEKILLSEIYSLTELQDGCFASNDHFGQLLGITKGAASKRIKKIKEKGYINTKDVYEKKSCVGRFITKVENPKKVKTETNQVLHKSTSLRKQTHVPNELEGISFSTREVLPNELDPTSPEKPINTTINSEILKQDNNNAGENDSIVEDVFDFQDLEHSNESRKEFNEVEQIANLEFKNRNDTSTELKKYPGISQSGMMTQYQAAKLQFEMSKDYLASSTRLGSDIFHYASEKKYFLLKEKLAPEVYAEIVTPMRHYIQARKALGLDKK